MPIDISAIPLTHYISFHFISFIQNKTKLYHVIAVFIHNIIHKYIIILSNSRFMKCLSYYQNHFYSNNSLSIFLTNGFNMALLLDLV